MVRHFIIGCPIETEAVVEDIPVASSEIPFFNVDFSEKQLSLPLSDRAIVYGLGENVRGINKRGWTYRSFNSDNPNHQEDTRSLYGAHNFFIVDDGSSCAGYFIDTPGDITFDIGFTVSDVLSVSFVDFDFNLYVIEASSKREIVKEFRSLIGASYIPPKWAFGYGQSRWSYATADEVVKLVSRYRELNIPIDSVYLDIDYLDDYKDFTIDNNRFPEFESFVSDMRSRGIHLVPIIDAGVKAQDGYSVCEEGLKNGYFCKKEDGTELVAAVWPGRSYLPDFLNDEARAWFGDKYAFLIDKGIDGFWNDMNEPAIFYTEDHLKDVFDGIDKLKGQNLDIQSFFSFKDLVLGIDNNPDDYRRFYHNYKGQYIRHDKVHNLYGYYMTRSASEAFERICPDKKILMFSRSSYIGMHRYAGIWTGDNKSWWSHLLLNLQQLPGLNMCGFMYSGADTGGFGADCSEELMLRWLSLSIFTPLFRNHSAAGTRRQELFAFSERKIDSFRKLIELRYSLIPYLYSEYLKAVQDSDMLFMPLSFVYDDARSKAVEDQLLVGESIMIAPVYTQNAPGRYVYLPEPMKLVLFKAYNDYKETELTAGDHYIEISPDEIAVFIRPGHELPLAKPAETVEEIDYGTIKRLSYTAVPGSYNLIIEP